MSRSLTPSTENAEKGLRNPGVDRLGEAGTVIFGGEGLGVASFGRPGKGGLGGIGKVWQAGRGGLGELWFGVAGRVRSIGGGLGRARQGVIGRGRQGIFGG